MKRLLFLLLLLLPALVVAQVPPSSSWPKASFPLITVNNQGTVILTALYEPPGTVCTPAQNAAGYFDAYISDPNGAGNVCYSYTEVQYFALSAGAYSVTPQALTCPSGYSVISGYCASCPAGQITYQGSCTDPCPQIGGAMVGGNAKGTLGGFDFAGDWTLYLDKNIGAGHFKALVQGDSGSTTYCEVTPAVYSYDNAHDTTYAEFSYDGSDATSSEVAITSLNGTSAHAAPGTGGAGAAPAQPVVVVNQTGDAQAPTTVTGTVSANVSGPVSTTAQASTYNVQGTNGSASPGTSSNPVATTATVSNLGGVNGAGTGANAPGTGNNPLAVSVTGQPSVVVVGGGSGGGSGFTAGTGNGQGGTTCCSAATTVGFPAWPTTTPILYTPKYTSWASVYAAVQSQLQSNVTTGWMMSFANMQLQASGNYNGGYPVVPFTLPQHLFGGGSFTFQLLPAIWDAIRAMVTLMTGYAVIWLVFRG